MSISYKKLHIFLLILFSFCLGFAYIIEYIFNIYGCPLCIYQRFFYLIIIYLSIISISKEINLYKYYILTFIFASIVAFYHTGVIKGIFEISRLCSSLIRISDTSSAAEFAEQLYNSGPLTKCSKPEFLIFGISLAEINLIFNIGWLIIFVKFKKILNK